MVVYKRSSACVLCVAVLSTLVPSHLCSARLWHKYTSSNVFCDFSKNSENAAGQSNTDVVASKSSESSINSNVDSEEQTDILTDYEKNNSNLEQGDIKENNENFSSEAKTSILTDNGLEQSDIKNNQEELKKTVFVDKDQFGKGDKSNNAIRSLAINAAKVGAGAVMGALALKGVELVINKNKDEGKEIDYSSDKVTIEKLEGELEEANKKIEELEEANKKIEDLSKQDEGVRNDGKKELNSTPGHRAYLWGAMSYLLEWLNLFGENQKDTKTLAIQNNGLRIVFSAFWLFYSVTITWAIWYKYKDKYSSNVEAAVETALTWICPPLGLAYSMCQLLLIKKQ